MKIIVTSGTGKGLTPLAAFDAALFDAGISEYNLIKLSSIIPPRSSVEHSKFYHPENFAGGERLYVVIAHQIAQISGTEAWAGLGWVQEKHNGRGLFVEQSGSNKAVVEEEIAQTLTSMMKIRRRDYGNHQKEIKGIICNNEIVCAVVAAIYKSENW